MTRKATRNAQKNLKKAVFIMSCIIPASLASATDLQQIAVKAGATANVRTANGQVRTVVLSPEQQQQVYSRKLVEQNKRSVNKYITALFTATGAATAMLGDAFKAAGSTYVDAAGAWTYQNGANTTSSAAGKLAFEQMVKSQPFKYVGLQIDVSAYAMWAAITWTEVITDYDSTNTYDYKPKVNASLNTYAQLTTTRFLRVGGEFNGNWGLFMSGITNAQTVNFTFNCVDIQRNW